jgi:hypothetical protein
MMPVYGPQPALRPGEKGERRHDHQLHGVIETPEPCPDQSHIVIEGQPAHEDIPGIRPDRRAIRPDIREEVGMGQDDPLGAAGAARGILLAYPVVTLIRNS